MNAETKTRHLNKLNFRGGGALLQDKKKLRKYKLKKLLLLRD